MQKNTEDINPIVSKTSNGKTVILSKCAICVAKKFKIYQKTRSKRIINYKSGHNILRIFDVLPNFSFHHRLILAKDSLKTEIEHFP